MKSYIDMTNWAKQNVTLQLSFLMLNGGIGSKALCGGHGDTLVRKVTHL
jgi:hypothetical protein